MIWFDLVTPKSVLFFKPIIDTLESAGKTVLVTSRQGNGYTEVVDLLNLYKIKYVDRGEFGGDKLSDKLSASIERQKLLMEYISIYNVDKLVSLCSVDASRVAFGLGMPIINFYDIPLSDCKSNFRKALPQARLTLPLSSKVIKPFVVPDEIFRRFSLEDDQIFEYQFLDPLIWLDTFIPDREYFERILYKYNIDRNKPIILIREEEYKASYVQHRYPILYDSMYKIKELFNAEIIIIPRYENKLLTKEFDFAHVLEEKIVLQHLLAFADLFIGGGGTINVEACLLGTPTISTRSFISHYDKYLIDNNLMEKADNVNEVLEKTKKLLGKRMDTSHILSKMYVNVDEIVSEILS